MNTSAFHQPVSSQPPAYQYSRYPGTLFPSVLLYHIAKPVPPRKLGQKPLITENHAVGVLVLNAHSAEC
jgi:hypothetical protein